MIGMRKVVLVFTLVGCTAEIPPADAPPTEAVVPGEPRTYGAAITSTSSLRTSELFASLDKYLGKTVTVTGIVRESCSKKGCWLELADSMDPNAKGCRVTFKDYGFFIPLQSKGALATVQGEIDVQTMKASEAIHLQNEGATVSPDTLQEVRIVATGVELTAPSPNKKVDTHL